MAVSYHALPSFPSQLPTPFVGSTVDRSIAVLSAFRRLLSPLTSLSANSRSLRLFLSFLSLSSSAFLSPLSLRRRARSRSSSSSLLRPDPRELSPLCRDSSLRWNRSRLRERLRLFSLSPSGRPVTIDTSGNELKEGVGNLEGPAWAGSGKDEKDGAWDGFRLSVVCG